jgi:hypothetical protein
MWTLIIVTAHVEFEDTYIEEEQTLQLPKGKGQKDKQRSTKHTHKTKDWVTRTPLKPGGELGCSCHDEYNSCNKTMFAFLKDKHPTCQDSEAWLSWGHHFENSTSPQWLGWPLWNICHKTKDWVTRTHLKCFCSVESCECLFTGHLYFRSYRQQWFHKIHQIHMTTVFYLQKSQIIH